MLHLLAWPEMGSCRSSFSLEEEGSRTGKGNEKVCTASTNRHRESFLHQTALQGTGWALEGLSGTHSLGVAEGENTFISEPSMGGRGEAKGQS